MKDFIVHHLLLVGLFVAGALYELVVLLTKAVSW